MHNITVFQPLCLFLFGARVLQDKFLRVYLVFFFLLHIYLYISAGWVDDVVHINKFFTHVLNIVLMFAIWHKFYPSPSFSCRVLQTVFCLYRFLNKRLLNWDRQVYSSVGGAIIMLVYSSCKLFVSREEEALAYLGFSLSSGRFSPPIL